MVQQEFILRKLSLRRRKNALLINKACILFIILVLFPACTGKMSVEEAKKITLSIGKESLVPPPRRMNDVLAVLDEPAQSSHPRIKDLRTKADRPIPDTAREKTLAYFYLERGTAAFNLFRWSQALEDLRDALHYAEKAGVTDEVFLTRLARLEAWFGNFNYGTELAWRSLSIKKTCETYRLLSRIYIYTGDLENAKKMKDRGNPYCGSQDIGPRISRAIMSGHLLYAEGRYIEAEKQFRCLSLQHANISPAFLIAAKSWLAQSLMKQARLIEAELEIRKALKQIIALEGSISGTTAIILSDLAEILHTQGRLHDAEKLLKSAIRIMERTHIFSESFSIAESRMRLGSVLADQGRYFEAMGEFELAKAGLHENQNLYGKGFEQNPNVMLSILKTGHIEEALELISSVYKIYLKNFGQNHYLSAELLGLRGMAHFKRKRLKQAFKDFSAAAPIMLAANIAREIDYSSKQRYKIILEAYIDLLAQIHLSQLEEELGINASAEAFRLADAIRGYTVQRALGASGARVAAADSDLSDIVRKEQDALQQISAMESVLTHALALPENQRDSTVIKSLKNRIDTLGKAQNALLDEIKRRFPKYSDYVNPQPATIAMAQEYLRIDESLISIYCTDDHTYIWAVPKEGKVEFAIANAGDKEFARRITYLREALDPEPKTFGDIPEFDISNAYELYSILLKPVEEGWMSASDLTIVADGPLGQLAFSVLPTSKAELGEKKQELFSNYRNIPWLIRKVSIARQPSVSSFVSLRSLPSGDPNRKAFAGFGDPFFNRKQFAQAEEEKISQKVSPSGNAENVHVRGVRLSQTGNLDSEKITTSHMGLLNRLPDTAEEIKSIAQATGADLDQDIFLGKDASEHQVKTMNLSDRRIVAFATHALVPGDLDGLDQPALALSSSSVTGENEDGLLTMGEILKLKLNADWVVLSACNTGAANGAGAEAASGLGRAFFYAGTRAILVSMWPVETTSARNLTTGLFRFQKEDKKISRARALRKSMLELIDGPGLIDNVTGKIVASYAHPLFWAPFIVVGESGRYVN